MTTKTETSALAILPISDAFDSPIKELCYEIWLFLADRNAEETVRLLTKQLSSVSDDAPFSFDRIPTSRTVRNWVKSDNWEVRANDHIRKTAKHIDETQISRMFTISDLALSFAHQLLRDGYKESDNAGILAVKWDAAKEMLKFRGLGTAGVLGAPTLDVKITNHGEAISELSLDERAELMRDITMREKTTKKLTGKK